MIPERRRAPRYPVVAGEAAIFPVSRSVLFLDISLGGVLVQSNRPAAVGTLGRLRVDLGGQPFFADVEIRRVAPTGDGSSFRIGAQFVDLSESSRQAIQRFTHQIPQE